MLSPRFYGLMSLGLAGVLGAALFATSEHVQHNEKILAGIEEKVAIEKDALRVLNAEWTYLNRPDRLEQLARAYLSLTPAATNQIVTTPAAIPEPVQVVIPTSKPGLVSASFETTDATPVKPSPAQKIIPPKAAQKAAPGPATNPTFNQLISRMAQDTRAP